MTNKLFSIDDACIAAKSRLPRIIFDLIDGAAGDEYASAENIIQLDQIRLQLECGLDQFYHLSSDGQVRSGFITDLPMQDDAIKPQLSYI